MSAPPPPRRARLVVVHGADPAALFAHAAAPFCAARAGAPLPLLALRQGGLRDLLHEQAARAGCPGWLGRPAVVFGELPALLAGDLAPLTDAERRTLLADLLARTPLRALDGARRHRRVLEAVDALLGDLAAERVAPERLTGHGVPGDAWEAARDADLRALYAGYLAALAALPPRDGVPRSDGRDGLALAADALRDRPDEVRRRLRRPLGDADAPVAVALYGLNDLRRGWDGLLDALLGAPFVDEVRVYVPLDHVDGPAAPAHRAALGMLADFALADALLARGPNRLERVPPAAGAPGGALGRVHASLFRADAAPNESAADPADRAVRAVAAPDLAREVEAVARAVKRLVVEDGAAPHAIAVVSRKARPYGPRVVDALRRHGVPVTARLRHNLAEVPAVAALVRVFRAAAEGWRWRTLADVASSPYFTTGLDLGLLRQAAARGAHRSLDGWTRALDALAHEAAQAAEGGRDPDEYRGPEHARARHAADAFAEFRARAAAFEEARTRAEWLALALRCVGRDAGGGRAAGVREGLWGLCRHACRPPNGFDEERDPMVTEATRRDAEALSAFGGLLVEWTEALALRPGAADEVLAPGAWHAELAAALDDAPELALHTPHRRGVQVVEASAAVWRTVDHLFVVGMQAGEFPAEPPGRALFGEHERAARQAAGLPLEPAEVWFRREASLLRTLVGGARRTLQVSYAYADAAGAAQIASAFFDEVVARAGAAVEAVPGSAVTPNSSADAWCAEDLLGYAARAWGRPEAREQARAAYAHLAGDAGRGALVARVLAAAGAGHVRRELRAVPPPRAEAAQAWNGGVTSADLLGELRDRFGPGFVWSATQLEQYGRCPFAFFARYVLGVRADDAVEDEELDAARWGTLVHACLARLHTQLADDAGPGGAEHGLTSAALRRAAHVVPQVVRHVLDEFARTGRGGPEALRRVRARELEALVTEYLTWEVAENAKAQRASVPPRRPVAAEVTFGMRGRPPVTLVHEGRTLRLRGSIDRVDEITDGPHAGKRYVVDHKTGGTSLAPVGGLYDEGANLQLPLYLHALARMPEGAGGVWGGAYQIAKAGGCERTAALHRHAAKRDGQPTADALAAGDRVDGALAWAFLHAEAVRGGAFPARIPEASAARGCPGHCEMRDVCREDRRAAGGAR